MHLWQVKWKLRGIWPLQKGDLFNGEQVAILPFLYYHYNILHLSAWNCLRGSTQTIE